MTDALLPNDVPTLQKAVLDLKVSLAEVVDEMMHTEQKVCQNQEISCVVLTFAGAILPHEPTNMSLSNGSVPHCLRRHP